jgi:hypothetical protein
LRSLLLFISILFLLTSGLYAQNGQINAGGRSFGIGNASLTLRDPFALFNNIAGIARSENVAVYSGYDNRFGIRELQTLHAGILYPTVIGAFGASFFRFGDEFFSEQSIGLGYGHNVGIIDFGIKVSYIQYNIEGFGNRGTGIIEFGATAQILEELSFGTHIYNLSLAEVSEETGEKIPTVIRMGLAYKPVNKLLLSTEIDKDIDLDANFKAGLEYQIIENVHIRTGLNTDPFASFFGLGWKNRSLGVDYSLRNDANLGLGHHVSLLYQRER